MNPSRPGLFLVGRMLIAASTSALVIGLFRVLTSSWFRLVRGASVQEFIHFFQVYWFMCIELFVVISDDGLYFCGISGDALLSFFIASIDSFIFYFLLVWLAVCLPILLIFSKKSPPGFVDFLNGFCVSISFSSALILVISCLLLAFELLKSCSSSSFNFEYRVSILDLSLLLTWAFIAINFPLDTALNMSQGFCYVVSSFSLVLKNIFISAFISLFIQSTFKSQLFSFHQAVWF